MKNYIFVFVFPVFLTAGLYGYPLQQGKYIGVVQKFADMVIEHGRDSYGPINTPLFVDALNVNTREPYRYRIPDIAVTEYGHPKEQIVANFAFNQQLQITLRELSRLTGDSKYRNAATEAARYGLDNLQHENGLFWWGNHTSYDALSDRHVGLAGKIIDGYASTLHEMKTQLPDWNFLYELNPEAVKKYIGEFWAMAVRAGWENLSYGRHLSYTYSAMSNQGGAPFLRTYLINENYTLPYYSGTLMDFNCSTDMMYMAFKYYNWTADNHALKAGYTMLKYYMDMRFSNNLGASRYAWDDESGESSVTRVDWWGARYDSSLSYLFKMARFLEGTTEGLQIFTWAVEELTAYAQYKLTPSYTVKQPKLWAFALAYRLTGIQLFWESARGIFLEYGLGDIGTSPGENMSLKFDSYQIHIPPSNTGDYRSRPNNEEEFTIHALIELFNATGVKEYLELAAYVADMMISEILHNGFFVRQPNGIWARSGDLKYLALLHLEAAMQGIDLEPDSVMYRNLYYRSTHEGYGKDWDTIQYYANTGTIIPDQGTVPEAPARLSVTSVSGSVEITWSDVSNETGYKLERKNSSTGELYKLIATSDVDENKFFDTDPGINPYYRIRAYNASGYSLYAFQSKNNNNIHGLKRVSAACAKTNINTDKPDSSFYFLFLSLMTILFCKYSRKYIF